MSVVDKQETATPIFSLKWKRRTVKIVTTIRACAMDKIQAEPPSTQPGR